MVNSMVISKKTASQDVANERYFLTKGHNEPSKFNSISPLTKRTLVANVEMLFLTTMHGIG